MRNPHNKPSARALEAQAFDPSLAKREDESFTEHLYRVMPLRRMRRLQPGKPGLFNFGIKSVICLGESYTGKDRCWIVAFYNAPTRLLSLWNR